MNQEQVLSLIRAILQIIGTAAVSKGVIGEADWTTVAGAILMIVPVVWSQLSATIAAQKAKAAALPNTLVVSTAAADPTSVANQIAELPAVKQVISTTEVAESTASRKIVDAANAVAPATPA